MKSHVSGQQRKQVGVDQGQHIPLQENTPSTAGPSRLRVESLEKGGACLFQGWGLQVNTATAGRDPGGRQLGGEEQDSHFRGCVLRGPHSHAFLQTTAEVLIHLHSWVRRPTCGGQRGKTGRLWFPGSQDWEQFSVCFLPLKQYFTNKSLVTKWTSE